MNRTYYFQKLSLIALLVFTVTGCQQQQNNIATTDVVKIKTLEVNHLKIVDAAGKSRGEFRVMPDGTSLLMMNNDKGIPKLGLTIPASGGSVLEFADSKGKARIALGIRADETPMLTISDETGKIRNAIALLPDNSMAIELFDKNNKQRLVVGLNPDGTPALNLSDEQGQLRATLSLMASNTPSLGFFDSNKQLKAGLWINADNEPEFIYHNEQALGNANRKTCHANLKWMKATIELYNIDNNKMIKTLDKNTLAKLISAYPKSAPSNFRCPSNPPGIYVSDGDLSLDGFLKCTTHGASTD